MTRSHRTIDVKNDQKHIKNVIKRKKCEKIKINVKKRFTSMLRTTGDNSNLKGVKKRVMNCLA